jgi:cytochrome c oxidase cbb3-type subunit II
MFESKAGVLLIGGLGFFAFAFISNGLVPILMYQDLPERPVARLVNANLMFSFEDLERRFPEQFQKYIGKWEDDPKIDAAANALAKNEWLEKKCAESLTYGKKIYVGEACWHCHSQFIRPVGNESRRFGPVSKTEEYQNELQRPVMFGTRRVGPDLCREGGRRSNDWHAMHFLKPITVSSDSPMPEYPWFFDDNNPTKPNARGLAIMTYVQWLGSWLEEYPNYEAYDPINDPGTKKIKPDEVLPKIDATAPATETK